MDNGELVSGIWGSKTIVWIGLERTTVFLRST
nr:MAG TPA: hypothetical protein [Caudoviricetes sp.]